MEALAVGVPVITCDARGCREVVRDGVDGLVLRDARVPNLRRQCSSCLMTEAFANAGPQPHSPGANASAAATLSPSKRRIYERLFRTSPTSPLPASSC